MSTGLPGFVTSATAAASFGVEEGKTPITPELIDKAHAGIREAIGCGR